MAHISLIELLLMDLKRLAWPEGKKASADPLPLTFVHNSMHRMLSQSVGAVGACQIWNPPNFFPSVAFPPPQRPYMPWHLAYISTSAVGFCLIVQAGTSDWGLALARQVQESKEMDGPLDKQTRQMPSSPLCHYCAQMLLCLLSSNSHGTFPKLAKIR
jgi:hypothetical protein